MLRGYRESDVTFCIAVQMAVEDTKENKQSCKSLLTNTYNRDSALKIKSETNCRKREISIILVLPRNSSD